MSNSDLYGILWVSPNNTMQGSFKLKGTSTSDLTSTMTVRALVKSDLISTVRARAIGKSDLNSTLIAKYRNESDLSSFLTSTSGSYLDSTFVVRPHNFVQGMFEVIPPPRIDVDLSPIKDSTTRSANEYKYINYGKISTMMVGNNSGDVLRSFLQFDVSSYTSNTVVEKAKVRLYYSGTFTNTNNLELRTVNKSWDEQGITDVNKPSSGTLVSNSYTINYDEEYIEFNVLNWLSSVIKEEIDNYGLVIKTSNDTDNISNTFYTRESHRPPKLLFTYYDTKVWSIGKSTLDATMFIYATGRSDLNSYFTLKTDYDTSDLLSTFYVHRYDTPVSRDLKSKLTISKPELKSKLTIARRTTNDLRSKLTVRKSGTNELISTISASKPELNSTLYLANSEYLDSYLTVRVKDKSELISNFVISRPEIDSTLFVKYSNDLESFLTIQKDETNELISKLAISKPELLSVFTSRAFAINDLDSFLMVKGYEKSELESKLTISTPELRATLFSYSRANSDLNSTMLIYQNDKSELVSNVAISTPELRATLIAKQVSLLDSNFITSKPELQSIVRARVIENNDLKSYLRARPLKVSDLDSYLNVRNKLRSGSYFYIL